MTPNQKNQPMKQIRSIKSGLRAVLVSAAVALTASSSLAQNVVLSFPTNSIFATNGLAAAWQWWGGAAAVRYFDATNDAGNDPTSGSIKITATWPTGSGSDYQYSVGLSLGGVGAYGLETTLNPLNYTNFEFDLKWDTNSTINITNHMTGGDPSGFGFGFVATQYGQSWVVNSNQPVLVNDGLWHHYTIKIDPSWPVIPGVIFKKYMGYNADNEGKTSAFWVDNLKFDFNLSTEIPKPQMTIAKAVKGLNIIAARSGDQYQREGIRSIPADSIEWYGNPAPVTYSWTIGEFPSRATAPGYFGTLFLVPNGAGGMTPDWDDPNIIVVETSVNAAGEGIGTFRFKTNGPASNGVLYGVGSLGVLTNSTGVLGTWSATFTNNSFCTLVGPSGASKTFDMGSDAAAFFDVTGGSLPTYFGFQPGGPGNIGSHAVYTRLKVQNGATTVVDDTFPLEDPGQETDPALWINEFQGGLSAVKLVDHNGAYWLDWNKPDGYLSTVQMSSTVNTGWADAAFTLRDHGTRRAVFVDIDTLASFPNAAYFRLFSTTLP